MKTRTATILVMLSLLTASPQLFAQTAPAPAAKPTGDARREQMKDRIRTVRLMRLVETLELDDQKALAVNKVMTEYEDKQRDLAHKRRDAMEKLEQEVRSTKPNEATLQKAIQEVTALEEEFARIRASEFKEVAKNLTTVQQAKFIVFRHNFNRAVGDAMHERHSDRRGHGPDKDKGPSASGAKTPPKEPNEKHP